MARFNGVLRFFVLLLNFLYIASYPTFDYCNGTSWIRYNGYCYSFKLESRERISYYDAEDYCRSQGAHLVSIHSDEENEFLLNTMEQGRFGGRMWIGFNVLDGDDNPKWSDGTPVDYQKRVKKEYFKHEKCFMMFLSQRGWRPEHCALHYTPICKRPDGVKPTAIPPPTTVAPPTGYCPSDWIQFGQKCYKYFGAEEKDRMKYGEARLACWRMGKEYNLASIHNMEEQAFLTQHLYDLGTSAWIGIKKVDSDEIGHDIVFGWDDNTRNDFAYWRKGHPPPGTWKYCGRLGYDGINKGEWIADYCEVSKQGYICQRPAAGGNEKLAGEDPERYYVSDPSFPKPTPEPSKCKKGFQEYRNACYQYSPEMKNQEKAEETCQSLGGHLVSITDGFEQAFLYSTFINESATILTGLETVQGTNLFRWTDKQPVYYSNWADGQPSRTSLNKTCVYMTFQGDLKWAAAPCSLTTHFGCKTTTDEPPRFPTVLGDCPATENSSTWIDIGDQFCYHAASSILSWDSTSRYCLTKGMKMISLHSDHEVKSLLPYFWKESRNVHLGLIRAFDKKSFIWVDGSPLNYTNWADREPSSGFGDSNCAVFSATNGKWFSINCAEGGVALCRTEKKIRS